MTTVSLGAGGLVSAHHLDAKDPRRRSAGGVGAIPLVGPIIGARWAPSKEKIDFALVAAWQWSGLAFVAGGVLLTKEYRRVDRARGVAPAGRALDRAMVVGGVLGTVLASGVSLRIAKSYERSEDSRFASRLQNPVVGGAWAAHDAPTHVGGYIGVASSVAQLGLLTVAGFGIARMVRRERKRRSLSVIPVASRSTAQVVATVRF